jgi:hypothetical protein
MTPKTMLFVAFLCLSIISLRVQAQLEIGLSGGYSKNYLTTSTEYRAFTQFTATSGFTAGVPIRYTLTDWLSIQAEPTYIQKNYTMVRSHFFDGIYQKTTNSYIQLPVMAHFSFGGDELRGFFNLGGYGAYWASSHIKGTAANVFDNGPDNPDDTQVGGILQFNHPYNYDEKYSFDSRRDRRIEFGLMAGAGIEYLLNDKYRFFVEGRYYRGLSDQQKNYMINQIPRYNDTYVIQAGCLFSIKDIFQ